jgi:hypothetical protein
MIPTDKPNGYSLSMEILSSLGPKPAPLRLIAEDFGVSVERVRHELIGVPGVVFERYGASGTVRIAALAAEDARRRCEAYWSIVHQADLVAA